MIQRIQSVWLLLAGICALLTIQFPFYSGIVDPLVPYNQLTAQSGGILILLMSVLIAVLAFVTIALYKNRSTQYRICVSAILLEALLIVLYYKKTTTFSQGTFALASVLHLLIILFFVFAAKGIKKDEKLIKDSDRLR